MKISKEIKDLAIEIHKAEHRFCGDKMDSKHRLEEYYYLLGSIVLTKVLEKVESSNIELFNKIIDMERKFDKLDESMKEISKQQKYLWQSLEEKNEK